MNAAVLLLALTAGEPGKLVSIAVTDLKARGVDDAAAGALTTELTNTLSAMNVFRVISGEDIKRLLTLEATRQACTGDGDAACLAEIGGALGVDYLVYGEIARLGDTYNLSLSLLDTAAANAVGRANKKIEQANRLLGETSGLTKVLVRPLLEQNRGFLVLEVAERGAKVQLDGKTVGVTPLGRRFELPMGPHDVVIEKGGFVAWARTVDVEPGSVKVETITLVPNQAFIGDYERTASTVRAFAWGTAGLATAGLVAAGALRLVNDARFDELVSKRWLDSQAICASDLCPTDLGRANGVTGEVERIERADTLALGLAIGGGLSAILATVLFATGDPPGRYAAFASGPSVWLGPAGAGIGGSF